MSALGLFNKFWIRFAFLMLANNGVDPQIQSWMYSNNKYVFHDMKLYYSVQKMSTDSGSHPLFPVAQRNNETKNI